MVFQPPLPPVSNSLLPVLKYSGNFKFSLSAHEVWFWQVNTSYSLNQVRLGLSHLLHQKKIQSASGFYAISNANVWTRDRREKNRWSQDKWQKISRLKPLFSKIPFIQAVFVTGALSVDNATRYDDIDIMVVTSPHTLWITRALLVTILKTLGIRRDPGMSTHSSMKVSDKICDNLWLDTHHLRQSSPSLYVAHEILQARVLLDKSNVQLHLLTQNSWIKRYLPIAFTEVLKSCSTRAKSNLDLLYFILFPVNLTFWLFQMIYMSSRITTEKVGLGFAFFHPRSFKDL